MAKRPNFLFIITDQHRADHLSCYGNPIVRTPNIDRLAQNGTRFRALLVATPICMPNRATLMTGRMPSLHGARQNGIPLSLTATTFVETYARRGLQHRADRQMSSAKHQRQPAGHGHARSRCGSNASRRTASRSRQFLEPARPLRSGVAVHLGNTNPNSSRRSPITALTTSSSQSATAIKLSATTRAG